MTGLSDAGDFEFYRSKSGFLALRHAGEDYKRIKVLRALPLSRPDVYICVSTMDNKEIGIIESLDSLPREMADMVREELESRYYSPEITGIKSIKEKMGFYYFDTMLGDYKKTFSVKDISKSIKQLKSGIIMITDVDGNRYLITDLSKIASKTARQIEPYLD